LDHTGKTHYSLKNEKKGSDEKPEVPSGEDH
jgi:hypothetical protein